MTVGISNSAVADLLERHGRLLEIAGESPFRTRAFTRAAESLRLYPERVAEVAAEGRLREIPGIGEGIAAAIMQILETGSFDAHSQLTDRIPESLVELTAIPGVGAKTALRLYSDLGVDSLAALEAALVSGRVRSAKGLGARAEATMLAGIEALQRRSGRIPLGVALPAARAFMAALSALRPHDAMSLAGSARRWDVTVGDLDFVVGSTDFRATQAAISSLAMVTETQRTDEQSVRVLLASGISADVFLSQPEAWGTSLLRATGNALHLERLGAIPDQAATEEEVYASHGLPFIPPELRTGQEEFERFEEIPSLVTLTDINGEFHAHTTWSDGSASVRQMAEAAAARGYSLLGITDHSQGLAVAGGLDVERLRLQRIEIDEANSDAGVKLLAGAEVEVHRDGSLDFDDETLAGLDVVVASLHSGLRQPRDEITATTDSCSRKPERRHHCPPFGPIDRAAGRWRFRLGPRLYCRRADRHSPGDQRRSCASRPRPSARLPRQSGWVPDLDQLRRPQPIRFFPDGVRRRDGQKSLVEARSGTKLLGPGPNRRVALCTGSA